MGRLRVAVALAAVSAIGVFAGQAGAGVHVTTVSAVPLQASVWQPGVVPSLGIDGVELRAPTEGAVNGSAPTPTAPQGHEGGWTDRSESWQKKHDDEKGGHGHHGGGGGQLSVPTARGSNVVGSPSGLNSWHGLDHWDERFGPTNQFSLEPPDQGLCVANGPGGQVLEVVNGVIRSFTQAGAPMSPQISMNEFMGYPPAIIRRPVVTVGPQVTDPSCLFDARAQKFIVIALTYEVIPTGAHAGQPTGPNRLDIVVTSAAAPTVPIQHYKIPVQDDGTEGTPSHPNCPCVGDFPQFGMDENGIHITTNEYPWFTDGFNGAQIYSFSRKQVEAGSPVLRVVHFDDLTVAGNPAFTVWPTKSNEGDYNTASGGTENFASSMAAVEANNTAGIDNRIAVWWLRNTRALDTPAPEAGLRLSYKVQTTETYAMPPPADQKAGTIPLADCLNHDECATFINGEPDQYKPEVEGPLDSSDTRILTHWYVNGQLLTALDTGLKVNGQTKAGIAWFAFDASSGRLQAQSYLAVAGNNVIYPAIATLRDGRGAMAFSLAGQDWYPSAAYAPLTAAGNGGGDDEGDDGNGHHSGQNGDNGNRKGSGGNGRVTIGSPTLASAGIDAQDGFSEYRYYSPTGDGVPRPRWGDFGAAVSTGSDIWVASEYIGQTCGTTQPPWVHFFATNFQCADSPNGHRRTLLANWGTRVTQVVLPSPSERR
jgi:hypothetical protein